MKLPLLAFIAALSVCRAAFADPSPSPEAELENKLSRLIIPKLEFKDGTRLRDGVAILRHELQKAGPEYRKIRIKIELFSRPWSPSTLAGEPESVAYDRANPLILQQGGTNISALEALDIIAHFPNEFWIGRDTIHIIPIGTPYPPLGPDAPKVEPNRQRPQGSKLTQKLRRIILPEVKLENATFDQTVTALSELSQRYDKALPPEPSGVEVHFEGEPSSTQPFGIFERPAFPPDLQISYAATNVSVADALDAVAHIVDGHVSLRMADAWFTKSEHPVIETKEYHLPPQMTETGVNQEDSPDWKKMPPLNPEATGPIGGGVSRQPERSAIYIQRRNCLIVVNTPEIQDQALVAVEQAWRNYYASPKWEQARHFSFHSSSLLASIASMATDTTPPAPIPAGPLTPRQRIERTLRQIIMPKLDLRDASLSDALHLIDSEIRRHDPHSRSIPIIHDSERHRDSNRNTAGLAGIPPLPPAGTTPADHPVKPPPAPITVSLTHIDLFDALIYITGVSGGPFRIETDGIHILPAWEKEPMFTQDFAIPREFFSLMKERDRLLQTTEEKLIKGDITRYLCEKGIHFETGTSAVLTKNATHLRVHNTHQQLDLIPAALDPRSLPRVVVPGPYESKIVPDPESARRAELNPKLEMKLQQIILPEVRFENIGLREVLFTLSELGSRADTLSPKGSRGVKILAREDGLDGSPNYQPEPFVSYTATHVTLRETIDAIARHCHFYVYLEGDHVNLKSTSPIAGIARTYYLPPTFPQLLDHSSKTLLPADTLPTDPQNSSPVQLPDLDDSDPVALYITTTNQLKLFGTEKDHERALKKVEEWWRNYYATLKPKRRART